jgi:hypothetical protein
MVETVMNIGDDTARVATGGQVVLPGCAHSAA